MTNLRQIPQSPPPGPQLALELPVSRAYPHLHGGIFHAPNRMIESLKNALGSLCNGPAAPETPESLETIIRGWLSAHGSRHLSCRPKAVVFTSHNIGGLSALSIYYRSLNEMELAHLATWVFRIRQTNIATA
jgi:hypothetical protein